MLLLRNHCRHLGIDLRYVRSVSGCFAAAQVKFFLTGNCAIFIAMILTLRDCRTQSG